LAFDRLGNLQPAVRTLNMSAGKEKLP
jgi:hypothetical protein